MKGGRQVAIWLGGTTSGAVGIAILMSASTEFSFGQMLLVTSVATYAIAGTATSGGKLLIARIRRTDSHPDWKFWMRFLLTIIPAVLIADAFCFGFYRLALPPPLFEILWPRLPAFAALSVILTLVVAPLATYLEWQSEQVAKLKQSADGRHGTEPAMLHVLFRGGATRIPCGDIFYLSAAGRRSVIHTRDGDVEVAEFLGALAERLPPHFLSVHRSYILNTGAVRTLRHEGGGRYFAILADGDDTVIPVSRRRVRTLRALLSSEAELKNGTGTSAH